MGHGIASVESSRVASVNTSRVASVNTSRVASVNTSRVASVNTSRVLTCQYFNMHPYQVSNLTREGSHEYIEH